MGSSSIRGGGHERFSLDSRQRRDGDPLRHRVRRGLGLSGNSPDDTSSDQTITDYWFIGHLHADIRSVEGGGCRAASILPISGHLFAGMLAISASVGFAFSVVISDAADRVAPDTSTFLSVS